MISIKTLKHAISLVKNALGKKKGLSDALMAIKVELDATAHRICLTATDLEKSSRAVFEYHGAQSASFMLDPVGINAIARLSAQELTLDVSASGVALQTFAPKVKINLPFRDTQDFPDVSWDSISWSDNLPSESLQSLFFSVAHACSKDHSRPALQGIRFVNTEDTLNAFATDGHRLAWFKVKNLPVPDMLLPTSSLSSIAASLNHAPAVKIGVQTLARPGGLNLGVDNALVMSGTAVFESDDKEDEDAGVEIAFWHSFRLLDASSYPPIQSVIEKQMQTLEQIVKVNVRPVRSAVELARMFDASQKCNIHLQPGHLYIKSKSELGAADIELDLVSPLPDALNGKIVMVNSAYLIDAMASCLDDEVSLILSSIDGKALVFDDGSKTELIMPMRG